MVVLLFMATIIKLAFEHRIFRNLVDEQSPVLTPLNKTARLLADELGFAARSRVGCAILGGVILPLLLILNYESAAGQAAHWQLPVFLHRAELLDDTRFSPRSRRQNCPETWPHENHEKKLVTSSMARSSYRRSRPATRQIRARTSARTAQTGQHDNDGLRLLLHRLRAVHPS
jgi:hypothetical protein